MLDLAVKRKAPGLAVRNGLIFNPVLVQAVGLCPVVAMANSVKAAAIITAISFLIISATEYIASAFLKVVPRRIRIGLYIILDALMVWPIMVIIEKYDPASFGSLGIYLPIMAVNSLVVMRCERFAVRLKPVAALKDGLTASLGYGVVTMLVGTVREIVGSGSVVGYKFWDGRSLPAILLPFGGFLVIGFAAAVLRYITSLTWPKYLDKKQPKPVPKKQSAPAESKTLAPAAAGPAPEPEKPVFEPENTSITFNPVDFDTQMLTLDLSDKEGGE